MKGDTAEYVLPLRKVFDSPRTKRGRRAITAVKRFVKKHARTEDVVISNEVNQAIWANSQHIPKKLGVVLNRHDDKVYVYLKEGKELEKAKKQRTAEKKKRKEKKAEEEKKTETEKAIQEEEERKLKEKRQKELSAEKADMKRKTGRE